MSQTHTPAQLIASLDAMLVTTLWQHVAYGYELVTPNLSHVGGVYIATREGFDAALDTYTIVAREMQDAGITRDQAWAAVPGLAPWAVFETAPEPAYADTAAQPLAIEVVGLSGWSPGVLIDYSGAGA